MSVWQPIETAPKENRHVLVKTAAGCIFSAYLGELVVGPEGDTFVWAAVFDGVHPASWTDGLCWAENEDGEPSDPVTAWCEEPRARWIEVNVP